MRFLLSFLASTALAASFSYAQGSPSQDGAETDDNIIVTGTRIRRSQFQDQTGDEINIIPEEKLSWEEAANHRDITVVQPGPNGLVVVPPESISEADKSKLLQQRKSVVRLEDQVEVTYVDILPVEPEIPEARILPAENLSEQDQELPEED